MVFISSELFDTHDHDVRINGLSELFTHILESLYFADTFGSFMPKDVERIFKTIRDYGFEKISFHAHNNLQLAFTNTIKAIELGAYSIDGSVFGMGRGGGNLPVELLLNHVNLLIAKLLVREEQLLQRILFLCYKNLNIKLYLKRYLMVLPIHIFLRTYKSPSLKADTA